MTRRFLIAGNWKMHLNTMQASLLMHRLQERVPNHRDIELVVCPSMLTLQPLSVQIDRRKFRLGAQNAHFEDAGAFTGEVSFTMLRELVHYVIIGHSERRHIFGETNEDVMKKTAAAFRNDITPIMCVGETKTERMNKETKLVLHDQIVVGLRNLTRSEVARMVIAYEPVWAIGTGEVATPDIAAEAVAVIRHNISELYGKSAARDVRVLYGGSVIPDVVSGFIANAGIDGFLVGGASINYHQFSSIVSNSFNALHMPLPGAK
jgi:triosephosphate isomerase (TIM)